MSSPAHFLPKEKDSHHSLLLREEAAVWAPSQPWGCFPDGQGQMAGRDMEAGNQVAS